MDIEDMTLLYLPFLMLHLSALVICRMYLAGAHMEIPNCYLFVVGIFVDGIVWIMQAWKLHVFILACFPILFLLVAEESVRCCAFMGDARPRKGFYWRSIGSGVFFGAMGWAMAERLPDTNLVFDARIAGQVAALGICAMSLIDIIAMGRLGSIRNVDVTRQAVLVAYCMGSLISARGGEWWNSTLVTESVRCCCIAALQFTIPPSAGALNRKINPS